jgi:hypothetical protein
LCLSVLFELKQVDEAGHREYLAQVVAQSLNVNVLAKRLGAFQNAEEDAQTAGRDIVQFSAVKDDVALNVIDDGLHFLLYL